MMQLGLECHSGNMQPGPYLFIYNDIVHIAQYDNNTKRNNKEVKQWRNA